MPLKHPIVRHKRRGDIVGILVDFKEQRNLPFPEQFECIAVDAGNGFVKA